jgi:hypothetical protein
MPPNLATYIDHTLTSLTSTQQTKAASSSETSVCPWKTVHSNSTLYLNLNSGVLLGAMSYVSLSHFLYEYVKFYSFEVSLVSSIILSVYLDVRLIFHTVSHQFFQSPAVRHTSYHVIRNWIHHPVHRASLQTYSWRIGSLCVRDYLDFLRGWYSFLNSAGLAAVLVTLFFSLSRRKSLSEHI